MSFNTDLSAVNNWVLELQDRIWGHGGEVTVAKTFHKQCSEIECALSNDVTGIVSSLLDFMINTASVNFWIETEDENTSIMLTEWLDSINKSFDGVRIESGVQALAKQYFRERWARSSLILARVIYKENKDLKIEAPDKIFFVRGGSVHMKQDEENPALGTEKYLLKLQKGKNKFLNLPSPKNGNKEQIFVQTPFAQWSDTNLTPWMVKNGILKNQKFYKVMSSRSEKIVSRAHELIELFKDSLIYIFNNDTDELDLENITEKLFFKVEV